MSDGWKEGFSIEIPNPQSVRSVFAWMPGQAIEVVDGPFGGMIGRFESVNPITNQLRVVIDVFGVETPVELNLSEVEAYQAID